MLEHDTLIHIFSLLRYIIELAAVPLLYGIAHYLHGIQDLMKRLHNDMLTIQQWRDDHDTRDNERFENVHARVQRLEERVDSCQAMLFKH